MYIGRRKSRERLRTRRRSRNMNLIGESPACVALGNSQSLLRSSYVGAYVCETISSESTSLSLILPLSSFYV